MGELMERRVLGEEKIIFVNGDEKVIKIHAIPSRKVNQFRANAQKIIYDKIKTTKIIGQDFKQDEFVYGVMAHSINKGELTEFDLDNNVETDMLPLFKKYFGQYISDTKKSSTSDVSEEK